MIKVVSHGPSPKGDDEALHPIVPSPHHDTIVAKISVSPECVTARYPPISATSPASFGLSLHTTTCSQGTEWAAMFLAWVQQSALHHRAES
jgi:hypothetical protein